MFRYLYFSAFASLLLTFAACTTSKNATVSASKIARFPQDYVGNWAGVLQLYNGKGKFQEVPMQLLVQPLKDSVGQYSWQIIYGQKQEDNRPYRLVPIDTAKQHWIIDENDGIKLDGYYLGGTFFSTFAVEGNLLTSMERVEGNKMYYEILTAKTTPLTTTGGTSKDTPPVDSYRILATQKAVLTRQK